MRTSRRASQTLRRRDAGEARHRLGRAAEVAAERMLSRRGLITLARNWRGGGGELDRVVLEGDTVVFVEVKARADGFRDAQHPPVSPAQRRRMRRAARAFRARFGIEERAYRFDLVTAGSAPLREPADIPRDPQAPSHAEPIRRAHAAFGVWPWRSPARTLAHSLRWRRDFMEGSRRPAQPAAASFLHHPPQTSPLVRGASNQRTQSNWGSDEH